MRRPTGFSSSATACSTSASAIERSTFGNPPLKSSLFRCGFSSPAASSAARLRATSSRIAFGTTSSTSPSLRAFDARTDLPARMMSSACAMPMSAGSRCVPPAPGMRPSCTSGWPSWVFLSSVAMRYVHASASSSPPPSAGPWMAAITGFLRPRSSSRCIACCPPRASAAASAAVFTFASISTSAPTTKLSGLADAMTMPFTAGSFSSFANAASKSAANESRSVFTCSPGTS